MQKKHMWINSPPHKTVCYLLGMKSLLAKRALMLASLAATVYAGALLAFLGFHSDGQAGKVALADGGMCPVPDATDQAPTYFVGCGGFF